MQWLMYLLKGVQLAKKFISLDFLLYKGKSSLILAKSPVWGFFASKAYSSMFGADTAPTRPPGGGGEQVRAVLMSAHT